MSRHPITTRIDEAVADLERLGIDITPAKVRVNVRNRLTYGELKPDQMLDALIDQRLRPRLGDLGYVIADDDTRARKLFEDCTPADFAAQVGVEEANVKACVEQLRKDRKALDYLRAKEQELGRPVTAGEFADEIAAIVGEPREQAA